MSAPPSGGAERRYDIHGIAIVVRCSDPAVLDAVDERLRAFARADGRAAPPDVRLEFLHGDERTVAAPAGPSRPIYDTPHGDLRYFTDADVVFGELAGVRLHLEAGAGVALLRADAFAEQRLYMATHPLLTIALMELLERHARYCVHAACLAGDGAGALLAGPSGAGKSTLTLALAGAGLAVLSDDLVFLQHDDGGVRALGFADALGVTAASAGLTPALRPALERAPRPGFPKRLVRLEEALPRAAVSTSCAPRLLIFPTVAAGSPSALTPLEPGEALLRLVPDVLLTQPAATSAHLGAFAALLDVVRTYELRSGADLERAAQLVVDELSAARCAAG